MRPGIGRNALGDCLTSRPEGCPQSRLEIIMPYFYSIILFPDARNMLVVFLYIFCYYSQIMLENYTKT